MREAALLKKDLNCPKILLEDVSIVEVFVIKRCYVVFTNFPCLGKIH